MLVAALLFASLAVPFALLATPADAQSAIAATVKVPAPVALAYDPSNGEVFVANSEDNTVTVISDSTDSVLATVPAGSGPFALAYDSSKGEVFVADVDDNTVLVIEPPSNSTTATSSTSSVSSASSVTVSGASSSPSAFTLSSDAPAFALVDGVILAGLVVARTVEVRRRKGRNAPPPATSRPRT